MSALPYLECFLAMEAHAAHVIDACTLPDGTNYWPMLRVVYNQCFSQPHPSMYTSMMVGQEFIIHNDFSISPAVCDTLQHIPQGGCAYFSRALCTVLRMQGSLFDPYLDPITFIAQRHGVSPVKFQLATNTNLNYYLKPLVIPYDTQQHGVLINQMQVYAGYSAYIDLSLQHKVPVIPFAALAQSVHRITAYRDLFIPILSAMQPSVVILEEYYNDTAQGIALACHKLGIPCAEYQHGLQTWPHIPYNFPYVPPQGYPSVPEWFFVWGEKDEQRYKHSFAHQTYHKVGVAGKPDYFAWKIGRLADDPALLARLKAKIEGKKVICVPLQGPDFPLPLLEECIRQAPADWLWLLRDHPIFPPVASPLAAKYPDRVETTAATKLNLHTVLSMSQHMVFGQSSAAFEAIALHAMRATSLDAMGANFYAEAVAEGKVTHAETVACALESIRASIEGYPYSTTGAHYIEQNEQKLGNLIKLLHLEWKSRHMHEKGNYCQQELIHI